MIHAVGVLADGGQLGDRSTGRLGAFDHAVQHANRALPAVRVSRTAGRSMTVIRPPARIELRALRCCAREPQLDLREVGGVDYAVAVDVEPRLRRI